MKSTEDGGCATAAVKQAKKPVTNRQRKKAHRAAQKEARDVATKIPQEHKRLSEDYQRRVLLMEKQRRVAERMCLRFRMALTVRFLDYRYWQCKSSGFKPLDPTTWDWWAHLNYKQRDYLHMLAKKSRARCPWFSFDPRPAR